MVEFRDFSGVHTYYSSINNDTPLHKHVKLSQLSKYKFDRVDLCGKSENIQAAVIQFESGLEVPPHKHNIEKAQRNHPYAQELWMVLNGKFLAKIFDTDDSFLTEIELETSDILITFQGGHSIKSLEENSLLLEFKDGPFTGRDYTRLEKRNHFE